MSHRFLGNETDSKGTIIVVKYSPKLAMSPPYTFFIRQYADLVDNGHGLAFTSWQDDECGVIWAEMQDKIVGFIVFDHCEINTKGLLSIVLTAVDPVCRGRRIYSLMHKWFEFICKEMGGSYVKATVSPKNTSRLKSCEEVGLKPLFIQLYKKV